MSNLKVYENLLEDFSLFLKDNSSYEKKEIEIIIDLLNRYKLSNNKKNDINIILKLNEIVFKHIKSNKNYSLTNVLNKNANSLIYKDRNLKSRHIWILRSIISRLKLYKRKNNSDCNSRSIINNEGILKVSNFLDNSYLEKIYKELQFEPLALNKGETKTINFSGRLFSKLNFYPQRLKYSSLVLERISKFIYPLGYADNYKTIQNLVKRTSFWQKINIMNKENDIQKDCHMDTFFPSLKFWYFPFSVSKKLAFKYAKRSNQLTLERMYIESKKVNKILWNSNYSPKNISSDSYKSQLEGSLRFNVKDLDKMNLNLESHSVDSNTLIIADVSGLHSRSIGEDEISNSLRIGIHGNIRHLDIF